MATLQALHFFLLSSLVCSSFAAIGPVADLTISNANISPDGYERAAVLAGETFPGPLITGQKDFDTKLESVIKPVFVIPEREVETVLIARGCLRV